MTKHWIGIVDLVKASPDIYFAINPNNLHWFSQHFLQKNQSLDEFVFKVRGVKNFNILAPKELSYWSKEDEIT